jgi:heme exporter protein CcmD
METPHLGFIVTAYALAAVAILTMIAMILLDYRELKANLSALEAARRDRDAAP